MKNKNWHRLSIEEVMQAQETSRAGLSAQEALARLDKYGANKLKEPPKASLLELFLEQFKSFLILILIAATIISMATGEFVEAAAIFAIVLMAGILGFVQNFRAEKAIQALKKMMQLYAAVIRDGEKSEVLVQDIVPGDIVLVEAGDRIPSDCRIIESMSLKVDEAALTGESVPVEKSTGTIPVETALAERLNMLYAGTACVYGHGTAIAVDTGMQTEFGKIAASLEEIKEEKTPLQVSIDNLGKWLGIVTLSICLLAGLLGVLRGYPVLKMLIFSISLAVAAVPEALPAVITICLALGTRRMVKRNALVRRLNSVETLGSVNVICSDKTGTLTKGEMSVRKIFVDDEDVEVTGAGYEPRGEFIPLEKTTDVVKEQSSLTGFIFSKKDESANPALDRLLTAGCLCNNSQLRNESGNQKVLGDPTEVALVVVAYKKGLIKESLEKEYPRVDEIPFSSERKMMTTIHKNQGQFFAFSKGAGEAILEKCALDRQQKQRLFDKQRRMAEEGLRVLAFAQRQLPSDTSKDTIEMELEFLGFMGMMDSPREEAKDAVGTCRLAGIKPLMITGDHPLTAKKVASELGILDKGLVLTGEELDRLSNEDLRLKIKDIEVVARVLPSHKLRIVEAYQRSEDIVAMTGDGVNDAPALKKADIGVAMGITGTEVSKEVSDLILLDDNFTTIVRAVEEGRTIFANIRKFLVYLLSDNLGAIMVYVAALLKGLPIPLTVLQILFINLIMDGPQAISLGLELPEPDVMRQPPRKHKESILHGYSLFYIFSVSAWLFVTAFNIFAWSLQKGEPYAMTMFFAGLIILRTFNAFNCRSITTSLFKLGLFTNRWLIGAVVLTILTTLSIIYLPFMQKIFKTVPLSASDWALLIVVGLTTLIFVELIKYLRWIKAKSRRQDAKG
jgi:Ca2+-transporting ATPase